MTRAERRYLLLRAKLRARRIGRLWSLYSRTTRDLGRMAAQHCTHECGMCHFEKIYSRPRVRYVTVRIGSLED